MRFTTPTVIDELEDLTLFREMVAFFGLRRFMELVGWARLSLHTAL